VNHNIFAETIDYFEQHEQIKCKKNANIFSNYFSYIEKKINFKSRLDILMCRQEYLVLFVYWCKCYFCLHQYKFTHIPKSLF